MVHRGIVTMAKLMVTFYGKKHTKWSRLNVYDITQESFIKKYYDNKIC